jgi:phosphate:Na+ symporter
VTEVVAVVLGGIGIFLVGMILLTEGLKAAAGDALRGILQRFARGPGSALVSGAAVTAVVQSSSATTLTTIGFVSAGLLTFPQAVGLILGANLGTTSTGWIVSVLGLRVDVAAAALPLVGVGALVRLLAGGRKGEAGLALAGFGLIFVGIDVLQAGMEGAAQRLDPASFPGTTPLGRLALVLIGALMTVVMQSSSAAVATVLTALHSGTLDLEQTAYLVIGQNVGTTVKAALASVGASVAARRTALAHILFNLGAGALALAVLPLLPPRATHTTGPGEGAVAIALFHTSFNLLGVAVFFPFLSPFAAAVERLVPERESILVRHLDRSVTRVPPVAVEAARRAGEASARALFRLADLGPGRPEPPVPVGEARDALTRIRAFLGAVQTSPEAAEAHARHLSVIHAVEHLERFAGVVERDPVILARACAGEGRPGDHPWTAAARQLRSLLRGWSGEQQEPAGSGPVWSHRFADVARSLARLRREERDTILRNTARGSIDPTAARDEVQALMRVDALAYHAWRAVVHLERADPLTGEPADVSPGASDFPPGAYRPPSSRASAAEGEAVERPPDEVADGASVGPAAEPSGGSGREG